MKTRKFLWALLPVAAVLLMTACGGDDTDDVTPTPTPNPVTPGTENVVKSVPYSVTVKTADVTRTSVSDDITLKFEKKDKLYVQNDGGTVYGCLELKSGVGETSATFAGTVNYTGSTPDGSTALTATLVGEGNELVTIDTDGKVQPVIYSNDYVCASMEEAVKKYSWISGKGTYGGATFTLAQNTAFMKFSVTIQDGTGPNKEVPVKITLGTDDYEFTKKTTGSQFDAHISFVLPLADKTVIAGDASLCVANVGSDDESIRIGTGTNVTLAGGNVYPVTRTKDFVRLSAGGPVWATKNLGASSVTGYGNYYAWGETTGYEKSGDHNFDWSSYKYSGDTDKTLTRYNNKESYGTVDDMTTFADYNYEDDAAYAALGASWRVPTSDEISDLATDKTVGWITISGISGGTVTGTGAYADKAVFLPATGRMEGTELKLKNEAGLYWSATVNSENPSSSKCIGVDPDKDDPSKGIVSTGSGGRRYGRAIRPVRMN